MTKHVDSSHYQHCATSFVQPPEPTYCNLSNSIWKDAAASSFVVVDSMGGVNVQSKNFYNFFYILSHIKLNLVVYA